MSEGSNAKMAALYDLEAVNDRLRESILSHDQLMELKDDAYEAREQYFSNTWGRRNDHDYDMIHEGFLSEWRDFKDLLDDAFKRSKAARRRS